MLNIPDISHPYIHGCWFRTNATHPLDAVKLWRSLAKDSGDPLIQLRLEWMLFLRKSGSVTATATEFGISRKCVMKWKNRFEKAGVTGLCNESRAPKNRRSWNLDTDTKIRLIELKRELPYLGKN